MPDTSGRDILYRYFLPSDDVEAITLMLHESYAPLATEGMRFLASHQHPETTARRISKGETIVAVDAGTVVGIITLANSEETQGSPFYSRPDVAGFGQFAVRLSHQGAGIGSQLLKLVEQRATEKGIAELALDTSESAKHLIDLYQAKGYRFIEHVQWDVTNYRSVILAKNLESRK